MKKMLILLFLIIGVLTFKLNAIDGFFFGSKVGIMLKVDTASAFTGKDPIGINQSINTGIGQYGATAPHQFPRVINAPVEPDGDLIVNWGYKFPKLFSLGFGIQVEDFVMPSLMFDFKFSFLEDKMLRPYTLIGLTGGLFDGFPIGITGGGGFDVYLTKNFYLLFETRLGAEIIVQRYYDDGNNSHPIWHFESTTAYGLFGIYIGVGFQLKNKFTDENGKLIRKTAVN